MFATASWYDHSGSSFDATSICPRELVVCGFYIYGYWHPAPNLRDTQQVIQHRHGHSNIFGLDILHQRESEFAEDLRAQAQSIVHLRVGPS